jgi:hypothetical protein
MSAAKRRILGLANNPPNIDLAIQVIAENLMKDVPHPPTNLEMLARRLNVSGFEAADMPLSGELQRDGDQFHVVYSSHLPILQRRFTIAHELGHAVFAMSGPQYPRTGDEVERICDMFAAEFLMPTAVFKSRLRLDLTAKGLLELSALYKAPLMAVALRAAEFGNLSTFVIEGHEVSWGFGSVRKGPIHKNNYYLKEALSKVTASPSGDITFPISGEINLADGRLTWQSIANGQQALCVLRKINPPNTITSHAFEYPDELSA